MSVTLITGGTGKTGRRITALLSAAGRAVRPVSRTGAGANHRFDWADPATFATALDDVSAIYLLAPSNVAEPLEAMRPFLEQAMRRGVRRLVLLSASSLPKGGPMMGSVHAYIEEHAPEWAVLRPTWFMQNFSEQQHLETIRNEGRVYSATSDGRIAFIDAGDIAAVAVEALTSPTPFNRDVILTGPASLSYDDVANMIGAATGKRIEHVRLTEDQLADRFVASGMKPAYARVLAAMDTAISHGSEARVSPEVPNILGRPASSLGTFVATERTAWM